VIDNQPPYWASDYAEEEQVKVGDHVTLTVQAIDPDKDPIVITTSNVPAGAFVANKNGLLTIRYRATANDVGPREIGITASDGKDSISKTVTVTVRDDWQSYFQPGLQYSFYSPADRGEWGTFQGVSAELLLVSWIHRNENRGPSHGRVFLDMDVLKSNKSDRPAAFDVSLGFDLSLERNPIRHFLLPYFGMKSGWFVERDLEKGNVFHLTPLAGMYLWADKNVFVTASAGYLLPLSSSHFDDLRGLRATAGANFSWW
jgi:hypothetical protein